MIDDVHNRRAVWCDFAGVLTAPIDETYTKFCATVGVPPAQLMHAVQEVTNQLGAVDMVEPLDTGRCDVASWLDRIESVLRRDFEVEVDLSDFVRLWFAGRGCNTGMIEFLQTLRRSGIFVGLVSNMIPEFDPHWRAIAPAKLFDRVVLSYQVGCRKPDPEIYDLCAQAAATAPSSCILIDDLTANCQGARDAGWVAVRFIANDDVIAAVTKAIHS